MRKFQWSPISCTCLLTIGVALVGTARLSEAAFPKSPVTTCAPDAVVVGPTCVDKYEVSVWSIPAANTSLIKKVQKGKATLADLTASGATQLSPSTSCSPSYPVTFPRNGNWTAPVYAASVAGVLPSACITWFQAEQACALSSKRLLTNQEWQRAAAGTPDPGTDNGTTDCNISTAGTPLNTASRSACVSKWGAFDMVGNVWEWVGDWGELADSCTNWGPEFGGDYACVGGPGSYFSNFPGALLRGGEWLNGARAGVFAVTVGSGPDLSSDAVGFRCAR